MAKTHVACQSFEIEVLDTRRIRLTLVGDTARAEIILRMDEVSSLSNHLDAHLSEKPGNRNLNLCPWSTSLTSSGQNGRTQFLFRLERVLGPTALHTFRLTTTMLEDLAKALRAHDSTAA